MSAILEARMIVRDAAKLQEYIEGAGPTLAAYGAKMQNDSMRKIQQSPTG